MAAVGRSLGFLLEDLMARKRRICMVEDQGLAEGQNRGPEGNVCEPWSHCELSSKCGLSPMGNRKPQKA